MLLKVLGFIFIAAGAITVFGAGSIVSHFKLEEKASCDFENEMSEDELRLYKINKAVVNVKMLGMLLALPGLIFILVAFK